MEIKYIKNEVSKMNRGQLVLFKKGFEIADSHLEKNCINSSYLTYQYSKLDTYLFAKPDFLFISRGGNDSQR